MRGTTTLMLALSISALSGCATTMGLGMDAYNQGQYQSAFDHFLACANEGDADCMNWIGVMYARGQAQSASPRDDAVQWYTLAARHGSPHARTNLAALGEPVPPPDLVSQPQPVSLEAMDAAGQIGNALGRLIGSGL